MQKYINSVQTLTGDAVQGATIVVTTSLGAPATVYSDNSGTVLASVTTDIKGMFYFYAADGRYNLSISGPGIYPYTITDIQIDETIAFVAVPFSPAPMTNVAGIRAIDKTVYGSVTTYGYYSKSDGGSASYYYDSADTASADNGITIIVATDGGRWKLINSNSYITARQCGAVADGSTDDLAKLQAGINLTNHLKLGAGIFAVTGPLIVSDGQILEGENAFWKRRIGYAYSATQNSVLKYTGASGTNTAVLRISATAVGTVGTDFTAPGTDDLICVQVRNLHVDAAGLADYGIYVYRAGNQSGIENLTAEKSVKANHVHLGCYAAKFGVFGSYESVDYGVACGWDIFSWGNVESTNYAYEATFLTANNGTGHTYVAGTATDQDNSGGKFKVGRGSRVTIVPESNYGRACLLSQYNSVNNAQGVTEYILQYVEGNADGAYVDYRDAMDAIKIKNGYIHPGNGSTLLPQNFLVEGKNNAGAVTADSGPTSPNEWLTFENLVGDLSGTGFSISSNTYKYIVRDCTKNIVISASQPKMLDFVSDTNKIVAGIYFTAAASPTTWMALNGTLARSSAGVYVFTFTKNFQVAGLLVPQLSVILSAALNTSARITSISASSVTIRTYDSGGSAADTGDRISFSAAGLLEY